MRVEEGHSERRICSVAEEVFYKEGRAGAENGQIPENWKGPWEISWLVSCLGQERYYYPHFTDVSPEAQ